MCQSSPNQPPKCFSQYVQEAKADFQPQQGNQRHTLCVACCWASKHLITNSRFLMFSRVFFCIVVYQGGMFFSSTPSSVLLCHYVVLKGITAESAESAESAQFRPPHSPVLQTQLVSFLLISTSADIQVFPPPPAPQFILTNLTVS